jgi:polar amino acid transport system substrate-binding protein
LKHRTLQPLMVILFALSASVAFAQQPLKWGGDAEGGAPFIFLDPKDPSRNIGFEVDLAAALAKALNRPIEFQQYEYASLLQGLDRGDFDFAMNGLERTVERAANYRLSRPYYVYQLQLVARKDETRFTTIEELAKLKLTCGTLEQTAAQIALVRAGVETRTYLTQDDPYKELDLGRIDAVLMDVPIAIYYGKPNPELKFVGEAFGEGAYAICFRKKDEALASAFDQAIAKLHESGELKRIYEKWGIWTDSQARLLDYKDAPAGVASFGQRIDIASYLPRLLRGAEITILISVLSMALAVTIGLPVAMCRLYGPWPLRWLGVAYVEFFRGIPVMLLVVFAYYGLPEMAKHFHLPFSFNLGAIPTAILCFGLNYAAYEAEIYRAGLLAIPVGQWEAAESLGMSRPLAFRRIILPQAFRSILPPMTSDFVALFKDTSIVSQVAVVELTKEYMSIAKASPGQVLEVGLLTALLYLILSVPLGYLSRYLEHRLAKAA